MRKRDNKFERAALVLLILLFFLPKGYSKEKIEEEVNEPDLPDDGENPIIIPPDDGFRSEVNLPPERETEITIREPEPEEKDCEVIIDEEAFERSFDHNLRSGGGGGGDWLITERDGNRHRMEHQFRVAR